MSAYALPGLFTPIESLTVGRNDTNTNHHTRTRIDYGVSVKEGKKEPTESSLTSNDCNIQQSNIPLHHHDQDRTCADRCINNDKTNNMNSPSSSHFPSSSNSNIGCLLLNSAAIAVKEAKIDPVRWIQYVTGGQRHINNTCTQHYAHQIGKNLRRRGSNSNSNSSGSQTSYVGVNNNNNTRKLSIQTRGDQSTNATGFNNNNNKSNDDENYQWTRTKLDARVDRVLGNDDDDDDNETTANKKEDHNPYHGVGLAKQLQEHGGLIFFKHQNESKEVIEEVTTRITTISSSSSDTLKKPIVVPRKKILDDISPFCNGIAIPLEAPPTPPPTNNNKDNENKEDHRFRLLGAALLGHGGRVGRDSGSKRPIIVSVGHKLSLTEAV
eukprot:CAMPEP_0170815306 /NCGR_PEP_ID=MMETSP0733-20121128/38362_1 /TAXON_ID=186038 /ORGANISM="Fragilariopsis kerguelensis, Strain L26-C5" /LENGTH=380 /DNA_ID=CAMNT_0011173803 /DNA_START=149 /DNA_END=1289 /DNA_ORIENTATION=+